MLSRPCRAFTHVDNRQPFITLRTPLAPRAIEAMAVMAASLPDASCEELMSLASDSESKIPISMR